MRGKTITIFGAGGARPGSDIYDLAYQVGRDLAKAGLTIANGGYGGTMAAAAKAAAESAGKSIGVTCSAFKRGSANPYITTEIVTANLAERLKKLIELGDAYVVLPGGTGTLLELAQVWELKNKGFISADKPIIIIGRFWQRLFDVIAADDADAVDCIQQVDRPAEILEVLSKFL